MPHFITIPDEDFLTRARSLKDRGVSGAIYLRQSGKIGPEKFYCTLYVWSDHIRRQLPADFNLQKINIHDVSAVTAGFSFPSQTTAFRYFCGVIAALHITDHNWRTKLSSQQLKELRLIRTNYLDSKDARVRVDSTVLFRVDLAGTGLKSFFGRVAPEGCTVAYVTKLNNKKMYEVLVGTAANPPMSGWVQGADSWSLYTVYFVTKDTPLEALKRAVVMSGFKLVG